MGPCEYVVKLQTYCNAMQAVIDAGGCVQLRLVTNEVYRVEHLSVFDDILLVVVANVGCNVRLDPGWGFLVSFAP